MNLNFDKKRFSVLTAGVYLLAVASALILWFQPDPAADSPAPRPKEEAANLSPRPGSRADRMARQREKRANPASGIKKSDTVRLFEDVIQADVREYRAMTSEERRIKDQIMQGIIDDIYNGRRRRVDTEAFQSMAPQFQEESRQFFESHQRDLMEALRGGMAARYITDREPMLAAFWEATLRELELHEEIIYQN